MTLPPCIDTDPGSPLAVARAALANTRRFDNADQAAIEANAAQRDKPILSPWKRGAASNRTDPVHTMGAEFTEQRPHRQQPVDKRDREACKGLNHMFNGKPLWRRSGKVNGKQRWQCFGCGSTTTKMVIGKQDTGLGD